MKLSHQLRVCPWPHGVAVDERFVYVSAHANQVIQVYDRESLALIRSFGGPLGPGKIYLRDNQIYVRDAFRDNVEVFSKDGQWIRKFEIVNNCSWIPWRGMLFTNTETGDIKVYMDGSRTVAHFRQQAQGVIVGCDSVSLYVCESSSLREPCVLAAINKEGKRTSQRNLDSKLKPGEVLGDEALFREKSQICAFAKDTLRPLWKLPIPGSVGQMTRDHTGALYVVDTLGIRVYICR